MQPFAAALLCASVMSLAGCGAGDDGVRRVPVSGRVTYNGEPLGTGGVIFRPDARRGNTSTREARGAIDAQGNYRLATQTGSGPKEGVAPGWYRVAVVAVKEADKSARRRAGLPPPDQPLIPPKYANPDTSHIAIQVTEAPSAGAYDIKLTR
jgi:hypothetical protein